MKNEQFDTRGVLKITIVRAKMVDGNLQLSCALPCTHCRSSLTSFIKYRYQKYGQVVRLQYSTNEGTLSPFMRISELPPSSLSSGSPFTTWRKAQVYNFNKQWIKLFFFSKYLYRSMYMRTCYKIIINSRLTRHRDSTGYVEVVA